MKKGAKDELGRSDEYIKITLLPRSSINQVVGKEGDVYRIKVTAPPVDGKANRALISLLSKKLRIPKGSIEIVSGERSRVKRIRVHGLSMERLSKFMDSE